METEALKKVLVDFLIEIVMEVKARAVNQAQERMNAIPERESPPIERKAIAPPIAMPRFISTSQAAQYWGTTTVAFRRMLERLFPELPKGIVVRVGKRVRVDMRAFESWLVTRETNSRMSRS